MVCLSGDSAWEGDYVRMSLGQVISENQFLLQTLKMSLFATVRVPGMTSVLLWDHPALATGKIIVPMNFYIPSRLTFPNIYFLSIEYSGREITDVKRFPLEFQSAFQIKCIFIQHERSTRQGHFPLLCLADDLA